MFTSGRHLWTVEHETTNQGYLSATINQAKKRPNLLFFLVTNLFQISFKTCQVLKESIAGREDAQVLL